MRAAAGLALALGLAVAACSSPDPDWAKPCAQQRAPSVHVGTGSTEYLSLGAAGVPIEVDTTGTYVWLGVSVQGFGQDVTVSGSITDAATSAELASLTGEAVQLTYDKSTDRDLAAGLPLEVVNPTTVESIVGKSVVVSAQVTGCGRTGQGQGSTTLSGFDTATCQGCLDQACAPQIAACDADCTSIQACLDTYCVELSALASPDESTCQAYCQSQFPNGKAKHVALVSCIQSSACQPPCNDYSIDYDECVAAQNSTACASAYAPCSGSAGDCPSYKSCVSSCSTWADCQRCATEHPNGKAQFEAYQHCVENTCLVLGWLPHE